MNDRCVAEIRTGLNLYLSLAHVLIIHWILVYGLHAALQCGVFSVTNPNLSNGVLRFENNSTVNISFSFNRTCEINSTLHIGFSMNNPDTAIFDPQCTVVQLMNNSCRESSSSSKTCGCREVDYNYFFTVIVRGNTMITVSVDDKSLMIPDLTISLTTFITTDPTEPTMTTGKQMTDYQNILLIVGVSAGVSVISFMASLILCWTRGIAQNNARIVVRDDEMHEYNNERKQECLSSDMVKERMNENTDKHIEVKCTRNDSGAKLNMQMKTHDEKSQSEAKGKAINNYYLRPVSDPKGENDFNHQYDEISEEPFPKQRVIRKGYDHLKELKVVTK